MSVPQISKEGVAEVWVFMLLELLVLGLGLSCLRLLLTGLRMGPGVALATASVLTNGATSCDCFGV